MMTAPEPYTADALWSAGEVRVQSQQVAGQLDVWDVLDDERDTASSASRQHYVETGHYGDRTTPAGWIECSVCDEATRDVCAWCEQQIAGEPVHDEEQQSWLRPDAWETWCSLDCHTNSCEDRALRQADQ
jgi:hypothetical protein